jgi:hypothetical protein
MIALGTFLVALGAIGVLIACGIAFNLRLYSHGAFERRRFGRPQYLGTAFAGPDVNFNYRETSAVDRGMSHYARRIVAAVFSIVFVSVMIVALLLSTAPH